MCVYMCVCTYTKEMVALKENKASSAIILKLKGKKKTPLRTNSYSSLT